MIVRTAEAWWLGDGKAGKGKVKFGSFEPEYEYSLDSRFEDTPGVKSEEVIGAEQARCFNIELAKNLEQSGFNVQAIDTLARVSIDMVDGKEKIISLELDADTKVMPHIDEVILREHAEVAKHHCPVSPALSGVEVSVKTRRMDYAA